LKIFKVTAQRRPLWRARITALEAGARYPLGTDWFQLDHGDDYFAFFDRLGDVHYYAAAAPDGRVAAVGAGIIRRVPFREGARARRAFYLCDLKVEPAFRGQRLPFALFRRAFVPCYLRCSRGYAISMDPAQGPNRVVHLIERLPRARIQFAARLFIYSCGADEMRRLAPVIERRRGPVSYLSLRGKKDLVLASTGAPLPLLHVQHGACAERDGAAHATPVDGHTHMFCAPEGDELATDLAASGAAAAATASIVQHRMSDCDWRFVLTSDI
jgi:hypothetical protein